MARQSKRVSACYRAIASAKKRLVKRAVKEQKVWERFGYCELINLRDTFHWDWTISADDYQIIQSALTEFENWCTSFSYEDLQQYMTA